MGLIGTILTTIFGGGRNVVAETVGTFRENAENGAERDATQIQAALAQFATEFSAEPKSAFDRAIDGLNRLPRPAMALGTLGLFVAAMIDPVWFASRMQGIALIPEPLWWLLGAVVGFYFGARFQVKGQEFQRSVAQTMARATEFADSVALVRAEEPTNATGAARPLPRPGNANNAEENAALAEWKNAAE